MCLSVPSSLHQVTGADGFPLVSWDSAVIDKVIGMGHRLSPQVSGIADTERQWQALHEPTRT